MSQHHIAAPLMGVSVAMTLAVGCTGPAAPSRDAQRDECVNVVTESGKKLDKCLPTAPADKRVDLATPDFSNPTEVTNPLHPTGVVDQTIYGGQVDGKPFRTEVTVLPATKTVEWRGQRVKALVSQYFALSDGRIVEVALDWYAQADDGSVWYLGEDVFNYADGVVKDTEGTWVAGSSAPATMIMPANPKPGDVYRPENAPGVVFEEVTVKKVDTTITGPSGEIKGAIVVEELHMDGSREKKTFAPGYGEFATGNPRGDLEAASLALPTDARSGPVPAELNTFARAIRRAADAVSKSDWAAAAAATGAVTRAWAEFQPSDAPLALLRKQTGRDIDTLAAAIRQRDATKARGAVLRVAQNQLDLRSRHQPVATTDLARMKLWARQIPIDAAAKDTEAVAGDAESLKWTWDRVRHAHPDPEAVDRALRGLRTAAKDKDLAAAATAAATVARLLS